MTSVTAAAVEGKVGDARVRGMLRRVERAVVVWASWPAVEGWVRLDKPAARALLERHGSEWVGWTSRGGELFLDRSPF